ncbi:putative membrane protein [Pedobacter sp. UYP30]
MSLGIWAIGQFFNEQKASSYFKAFSAYMLGIITFVVMAVIIGLLVDVIFKH